MHTRTNSECKEMHILCINFWITIFLIFVEYITPQTHIKEKALTWQLKRKNKGMQVYKNKEQEMKLRNEQTFNKSFILVSCKISKSG